MGLCPLPSPPGPTAKPPLLNAAVRTRRVDECASLLSSQEPAVLFSLSIWQRHRQSFTRSLELRRLKADLIVCFQILRGFADIIPSEFLCGRHAVLEVTV